MAVSIEDVLQVNLILVGVRLINTPAEIAAFRRDVGTEVATAEAGLGDEVIDRTHVLNRDRIRVTGTPERSSVVREYPTERDLDRLAQVGGMAISNTDLDGQKLRAYGFNVELVYEPDSGERAIEYLSKRLFMPRLLQNAGCRLFGGAGRLYFEKDGRIWQARLEPRLNDDASTRIFASLNLHRSQDDLCLPTETEISDSLRLIWAEVHNLVDHLDRNGGQ